MNRPSTSVTDKLAFHGKKSMFAGWKDKVKAHLTARSDALVVTELQTGRQAPVARYEDALVREPVVPEPSDGASADELTAHALQKAFVAQQSSYIMYLLNLTLPAGFSDERLMQRPVHEIWRAVEKSYGLNTASGVVELVQKFERIVNSDFKSLAHLFQQLKSARDQANRNSCDALETGLISQTLMMVKILGVLPHHLWGSAITFTAKDFTLERVESKLVAIFGNKSRAEITALGKGMGMRVNHVDAAPKKSALGKRKAFSGTDIHHNQGVMRCYYCVGIHNDMNGVGPHKKVICPKRAADMAFKVYRRDIFSRPSRQARAESHEPTPKMKGKGKDRSKDQGTRKEVPTDECLPRDVPCKAVQTKQPASPTVTATPPDGTFEPMDTDEAMNLLDIAVNHGEMDTLAASDVQAITATAEELDRLSMELEDKDAGSD